MKRQYDTIDTIIITTSGRTDSIRMSHTLSGQDKPAIVWQFNNSRFVVFSPNDECCERINEFVASLMDDSNMIEEMNLFTEKYTNTQA